MSGLKGMILIMLNEKGNDDEISCPGNLPFLPSWRKDIFSVYFLVFTGLIIRGIHFITVPMCICS